MSPLLSSSATKQNNNRHFTPSALLGSTGAAMKGFSGAQSSWKRMCLLASLARAMMIFSALDMSWSLTRDTRNDSESSYNEATAGNGFYCHALVMAHLLCASLLFPWTIQLDLTVHEDLLPVSLLMVTFETCSNCISETLRNTQEVMMEAQLTWENLQLPAELLLQLRSGITHHFGFLWSMKADVSLGISFQDVDVGHRGQFGQSFLCEIRQEMRTWMRTHCSLNGCITLDLWSM